MDAIQAVQAQIDALGDDPTRDELWAIVKLGVPQLIEAATTTVCSQGAAVIAAERRRQMDVEGWSAEHDDAYLRAELPCAAACYTHIAAAQQFDRNTKSNGTPMSWPWPREWWKPSADPIRNLEKAGALIAAEIDRLKRKQEVRHRQMIGRIVRLESPDVSIDVRDMPGAPPVRGDS